MFSLLSGEATEPIGDMASPAGLGQGRSEVSLKVAMEVLSILAFLLGSPLYVQQFAEPPDPEREPGMESNRHAASAERLSPE